MRLFRLILLGLLLVSLSFCSRNEKAYSNKNIKYVAKKDFKATKQLKSNKIPFTSDSLALPQGMSIVDNHIILLDNRSTKPIHVIDMTTNTYLGSYGKIGQGPGEIQTPAFMLKKDSNSFIIYDQIAKKLLGYDLQSLLLEKPIFEKKMKESEHCSSISMVDNNVYYTDFLNPAKRIYKFDTITNNIEGYGTLLNNYKNILDRNFAQACDALIASENNNFVTAYRLAPFFEIFNQKNNQWKSILAIDKYGPIYKEITHENNKIFARVNKKTKIGFIDVYTNKNFIYLLYSGNITEPSYYDKGNKIFVFDYDGNPINYYQLDSDISFFEVIDDNTILGLKMDFTAEILKFELK